MYKKEGKELYKDIMWGIQKDGVIQIFLQRYIFIKKNGEFRYKIHLFSEL